MFRAAQLTKRYGDVLAVDAVDLDIRPGEIFGLLGSNGAGKTTMMKVFMTLLRPDGGSATVGGIDVTRDSLQVRALLGYVPENPALYEKLTGAEFLHLLATLRGIPREDATPLIDASADLFRLDRELELEMDAYSRGMRQKMALAAATFHRPKGLVLDEPTNGLDPRFTKILKEHLRGFAADGGTVLISTHITDVAEAICDRVAVVHDGRVVALGTVDEVQARGGASNLEDAFVALVGDA
ncbi:MAG TPA: ABC transporter ATP-binding protein [Thermoplasmata archaeon]|jgi:ABC-2 type transport system ATP-binding protein|nr:ABC transporter ATP-binding protein [Thermoplasmata archaeon]